MNVVVIIQARTGSTRLPGKVFLPIQGEAMIIHQVKRARLARYVDKVIVATTENGSDDALTNLLESNGIEVYRGSENDVLLRYLECAQRAEANVIVRLTGDCPLTDPGLVDEILKEFVEGDWHYLSNAADERNLTVPDGLDIEVLTRETLERMSEFAILASDREHVTPWARRYNNKVRWSHFKHTRIRRYWRLTVDEYKDYDVIKRITDCLLLSHGADYTVDDVDEFLKENPGIGLVNIGIERNEGLRISISEEAENEDIALSETGLYTWKRAKELIPGGNMLLSKRAEMFAPNIWPSYFERAKGCDVWDLNGNKYKDYCIMGIGTNVLGYGNDEVDGAVIQAINKGNMSTLNCKEEVDLAEKLVEIHHWAQKVRFARTGGEANAVAVRIARAATGREAVAICGYHGWHDWYLSANLVDQSGLDGHLLPGLEPSGIPKELKGLTRSFRYNDIDELNRISTDQDLAALVMEVERSIPPNNGFLQSVRKLCDEKGIVLIFDECTSGFRENLGGLHLKYGVDPDMAMFGKAMGNGYAITAVIGKDSVMDAAQKSFISSTFWTERVGSVAALKTIEVMEREKPWEVIMDIGRKMRSIWDETARIEGLDIEISGRLPLSTYVFKYEESLAYKTYLTQEFLRNGFLASTCLYSCCSHNQNDLDRYQSILLSVFNKIAKCVNGSEDIDSYLMGERCHSGFSRLN